MMNKEIYFLIDNCIFFTQEKKDFLKRNFCIFSKNKQAKIINILEKTKNISATPEDFEVFSYGMKMWKNKKQLQYLESQDI